MITCPNCDKENEEGNKFCISCGADLSSKEILKSDKKQIEFLGRKIPPPALLEEEKVLEEFRASFWDLGIFGFILRYKERIVITTHRIFHFSQRISGENLICLLLRKIESIKVRDQWDLKLLLSGIAFLIFGVFGMHGGYYSPGMPWYIRLVVLLIAAILILIAKKTELVVTASDPKNLIAFPFIRLKKERIKRFIDLVSKAAEELNSGSKIGK